MEINELKKKLIDNAIMMSNGLKVVNLTSVNLFFDDGSVVPKGNKELLDFFMPVPVEIEKRQVKGVSIEAINYMPNGVIYEDWFLEFIENENIYFLGSHITCSTYKHHRFIMTQIIYKENRKKIASATNFTTLTKYSEN